MEFLNRETEKLLQECVDNSINFPQILAEKFKGISSAEDRRLRNRIKELIDNGYFSKIQWADGVPWFGTITEDGYEYFHKKDVFIRAKLRRDPTFTLLDPESENFLKKIATNDDIIVLHGSPSEAKKVENLKK